MKTTKPPENTLRFLGYAGQRTAVAAWGGEPELRDPNSAMYERPTAVSPWSWIVPECGVCTT